MSGAGWIRLVVVAIMVGGLEAACRLGALPATAIIAPSEMLRAMVEALTSGEIATDIRLTFTAVAIAASLAVAGGFVLGFLIHLSPRLRAALDPLLAAYYAIPHVAFYPLLIVVFGLGIGPLIVLATAFGIVAMIIATLTGLDRVPRVLMRTARVHRLSPLQEMVLVRLPAAMPHLLSGVKLALSYAFIGVIAGEFILSTAGVGHAIAYAYDNFDNRRMYGLIVFVIGFMVVVNTMVLLWERRLAQRRGAR
ncbi:ABC transporter permease [Reyranella sp. CPCC 100927]|uniref:ABC transporter permease n=1 Tax=Reyranella sp. CPCC 100927 TaxID=2599616 RepID=UPI0011B47568|nr:ABC transporter permease [Reyranella sp. CPCC 100927]TWT03849.1 ABC transporter permease [Reyranella sp. CPCC 100927]